MSKGLKAVALTILVIFFGRLYVQYFLQCEYWKHTT
jgi:hypothetical protein